MIIVEIEECTINGIKLYNLASIDVELDVESDYYYDEEHESTYLLGKKRINTRKTTFYNESRDALAEIFWTQLEEGSINYINIKGIKSDLITNESSIFDLTLEVKGRLTVFYDRSKRDIRFFG